MAPTIFCPFVTQKEVIKHIHIETQNLAAEDHWDPNFPVRGTEEFYVETASGLALLGHQVTVAFDGPNLSVGAVTFVPRGFVKKADVLLDCNTRTPYYQRGLSADRYIAWTNFADAKADQYRRYDALICISQTHRRMLGGGIVIPHGVDRNKYVPLTKSRIAIYTSSMDRGGFLLQANRQRIERSTRASIVFSHYPTGGYLKGSRRPLRESDMITLYGQAKWWIHPGMGVELFCIAAAKAQAAGCIPIVRPTMALDETVQCGYKIRTDDDEIFIQSVIDVMNDAGDSPDINFLGMPSSALTHIPAWKEATAQLAAILVGDLQKGQAARKSRAA
jgi:hypothetical protein